MTTVAPPRLFAPQLDGQESPAAPELIDRIALARADSAIHTLAGKIAFRMQEVVRKAGYDAAIQSAVLATNPADGIDGIVDHMEHQFAAISAELGELNDALRLAGSRAKARAAEIAPMIRRANNAIINRENEILRMKTLLNDARRNGLQPSDKLKAYRDAGLTAVQIAKLGDAGITSLDVEQAEWKLKVLEGELQRLNAFLLDPLHRIAQLQGLELTAADDNNPGRYVPGAMRQFGDAA